MQGWRNLFILQGQSSLAAALQLALFAMQVALSRLSTITIVQLTPQKAKHATQSQFVLAI